MEELYPHERTEELLLYSVINEPIYAIEEVFNSGPLETTDHLFLLEAMEFTKGSDVDEIDGARLILIGIVSATGGRVGEADAREDVIRLGFSYGPKVNLFRLFILLKLLNNNTTDEFNLKIIQGVRLLVKSLISSFRVLFGENLREIFQFDSFISSIL